MKRIDPWLVLIGPGAGRRKEAVKREAGGRGWREMVGVRGEEVVVRRGEEEREEGGSEMVEVRLEGGGAKGVDRKEGEREGFTNSWGGGERKQGGEGTGKKRRGEKKETRGGERRQG